MPSSPARRVAVVILLALVLAGAALVIGRYRETAGQGPARAPSGGSLPAGAGSLPPGGHPALSRHSDNPAATAPGTAESLGKIRVAAFNIQVFGLRKAQHPEVMAVLARIAREFDVLVVEEVRDASDRVPALFLERINAGPGPAYAMVEGPREGRTASTEQYVVYYVQDRVRLLDSHVFPDPSDRFEREPLIASFRAGSFDFVLVAVHIQPRSASQEMAALAGVAADLLHSNPAEGDIILLGDFNADCSYFTEASRSHPLRSPAFHWVITDDMDTNVGSSSCTYDRIILLEGTYGHEYVPDSAGVFRFDREYNLPASFAPQVSDHYPVYAEFQTGLPDDD